jgi:hypothetical protein
MSTLLCLVAVPAAHSQVVPGCLPSDDEDTRVETARSILKVNSRVDGGVENVDHYHRVINLWAEVGSGEDGVGFDGAVYRESVTSNFTRQEMWDYLDYIFTWSNDMELEIVEELWETHPDGSMTYMNVNRWFGSTDAGYYEQPGISIVKFRPDEGCVAFQRDYFTEGDTWWGVDVLTGFVRDMRERTIADLGLSDRCIDDDGDGYPRYAAAMGCLYQVHPDDPDPENPTLSTLDCDDFHADINPGADEIFGNDIDENCNGSVDD